MSTTLHARHYATNEPITVTVNEGLIQSVTHCDPVPRAWIAPMFFDIQINGCLGIGFNYPDLTVEQVRTVTMECRKHGIGSYCPTLITGSYDALAHGFRTLAQARRAFPELVLAIPGYHLEGPYLSGEDGPRGAHPREHIRDPNWDEFQRWQDAAEGLIRMVTVAPERDGALPFIEKLSASGVVVAIGHTAANAQQIQEAVSAGAKTCTHLGNGAHAVLPRHPNYIWEQLAEDRLWASIIPDGHHLPAAVVKCIVRAKSIARTVITCDASSLAGLPPGRYTAWGTELEVLPGGKVVVPGTPFLAGSGCFTDHCVLSTIRMAGITLRQAIDMATVNPCELLGLPIPKIEPGHPADLILIEEPTPGAFQMQSVC